MADSPKSEAKEIHTDPETGRMSSGGPKRYVEREREAEAG